MLLYLHLLQWNVEFYTVLIYLLFFWLLLQFCGTAYIGMATSIHLEVTSCFYPDNLNETD